MTVAFVDRLRLNVSAASGGTSVVSSTVDPTVLDDASIPYAVGQEWVNTSSGEAFILVDPTATAAVWKSTTAQGSGGGSVPTGTGFVHVTSGAQDGAAKLVANADISGTAAIALTKLANQADQSILGNNIGSAGPPIALTAAQLRTLAGLVIGTNVQAWDADLDAIAALSSAADKMPYSTGAQSWALTSLTSFARTMNAAVDAPTARNSLVAESILYCCFGDGSDGALVITTGNTTTLTASKNYSSIQIDSGGTLDSRSFKVRCSGTCTVNGRWHCDGNSGSAAVGSAAGGVGSAVASADIGGTQVGTAGAAGGTGAGTQASASSANTVSWSGAGAGAGGASGLGSGGAGVTSRGSGTPTKRGTNTIYFETPVFGATLLLGGQQGTGGGAGGGDGTASGGGGGGGGHGGGVLWGMVRDLVVGATAVISAKGGGGGAGGNAGGTNCGGGGGGAGAGGGVVMLAYSTITVTTGGTINATGGAGGSGGSKTGTGVAGSSGGNGTDGLVIRYSFQTGVYSNVAI